MDELSPEERNLKAEAIAKDILALSRNSLLVNFRFLDRALSRMEPVSDENVRLATDGEYFYYSAWYVLSLYRKEASAVTRAVLHSLFHCVFRHSFIGKDIDRTRWDLACDVAAENAIDSLGAACLRFSGSAAQKPLLEVLREKPGEPLTAERIYRWLADEGFTAEEMERERENFSADGHGIWYGSRAEAKADRNINLRKIWEDVSRRMQTELETVRRDRDSALVQNLKSLNRSRRSYTDFLKRFGVHGEVMHLSDEEFDNNYYSYGMDLYGNIPLIEPLEYCEQKRIREFVIAIDTSGSVKGEVVQSFIQHTHDILSRQESFFTKVNMYIIQCDDAVEDVARITCREDFKEYIKHLEIKGLGRTDFRPVFEYVSELIRKKELTQLQGLIYFTDGLGIFPAEKPPYETAFIIHRGDYEQPPVPSWAQHMAVTEEDILDRRFSAC